jgi:hypothetical protein
MRRGGHRSLSHRLFGPLGRGGPGQGPRGVGPISRYTWIGLLTVAVLLGTALSCKQVKELAIPGPDSDATALYVLKIVNIQPDDIDMNTEGTASATVFARLTDARGTPLGGQVLFFEVLDVTGIPFRASAQIQETEDRKVERFACNSAGTACAGPIDCGSPLEPPPCGFVRIRESIQQQTKDCVGTEAGTLPGALFGDLRFRYRTTDGDGRAQTEFTSARVKKFMDLAFVALGTPAQLCLGVNPESSTETRRETEDQDINSLVRAVPIRLPVSSGPSRRPSPNGPRFLRSVLNYSRVPFSSPSGSDGTTPSTTCRSTTFVPWRSISRSSGTTKGVAG